MFTNVFQLQQHKTTLTWHTLTLPCTQLSPGTGSHYCGKICHTFQSPLRGRSAGSYPCVPSRTGPVLPSTSVGLCLILPCKDTVQWTMWFSGRSSSVSYMVQWMMQFCSVHGWYSSVHDTVQWATWISERCGSVNDTVQRTIQFSEQVQRMMWVSGWHSSVGEMDQWTMQFNKWHGSIWAGKLCWEN